METKTKITQLYGRTKTMLKIMVSQWDKNKDEPRSILAERTDLNDIEWDGLVKLTFCEAKRESESNSAPTYSNALPSEFKTAPYVPQAYTDPDLPF